MKTTTENTSRTLVHQFIIDQSSSMSSSRNQVIDLFNELTEEIKTQHSTSENKSTTQQLVGLCVFDGQEIAHRLFNRNIDQLMPLTHADYQPKSMTPLFDAIGSTIHMQDAYWEGAELSEYDVLVTILTDGMENVSKNFNAKSIQELIKQHESANWTFTYMGAHGQVHEEVQNLAMSQKNATRFDKSQDGFDSLIIKEKEARKRYMSNWEKSDWRESDKRNYY